MTDWQVITGDCLDVLPTLAAGSVDAVITDPPYSSGSRQSINSRGIISKNGHRANDAWLQMDTMGHDTYVRWMRQVAGLSIAACQTGAHGYVFTDWRQYTNIVTTWESVGWTLRSVVVWDKNRGGAMGSFWRNNHEWVCVFAKGTPSPLPDGSFFNTYRESKPQGGVHPTEKPLGLMRYLIRAIEGVILDPFCGSGTTGEACMILDRRFIGIEIDPGYADIARARIAKAAEQARQLELPIE